MNDGRKPKIEQNINAIENMDAVKNMHQTFLEALRSREQEILQFITILAPALGGFVWLLKEVDLKSEKGAFVFTIGTLSVQFFLWIGSLYSAALGYNFRYVTFQLAKLELPFCLNINKYMLNKWPRSLDDFKKYKFKFIPWCSPPEIIKVFWFAFVLTMVGITFIASYFLSTDCGNFKVQIYILVIVSIIYLIIGGLLMPILYGCRMHQYCKKEEKDSEKWNIVESNKKD